ncbi:hydrogenase maturation nickel metallochaperone HypA [Mycobacterium xenopi]|uniref:hydrogenase maturation nickel metallochaperone HypA n=1 Tax=Mycobacterium xenopi TaxID=1789 RepID=UPI00044E6418|nr:hydrogenase maturation nickel metallochaperone HypA [Mycobacterium xenopi]EUA52029.1 hydrogenase expression/synthesis hypA family protein [Mycobacterium xenopi 3993]
MRKRADGRGVRIVNLRIGELRQIVPDTLVYCWSLVTEGSELAATELCIERIPAKIRCNSCGCEQVLTELSLLCPACLDRTVDLVEGDEFLLTSLELTEV